MSDRLDMAGGAAPVGPAAVPAAGPPPPAIPRRSVAERRRARRRAALRKYGAVLILLSPWIVGFVVFTLTPMIISLYWSFTHYDMASAPRWVGLDNYRFMFGVGKIHGIKAADPYFWTAVRNTLWIIVFGVPLRVLFAMVTAMLLTRPKRGTNAYRTLFFMPSMAPKVAAALVFVYLLNPTTGPVNQLLNLIPGVDAPLWFYDPAWSKPSLLVLGLWGIGDAIVIYLAGLLSVPRELYEAIAIEGANAWQRFRNVTLPLITPVIFFTIVMGVIDGFQYFDQAFVASNVASGQTSILGTPQNALLFYSVYLYQWAFRNFNMGYAAAMAWVLFAATMVATAVLLLTSRRWVHYGGGGNS
jgi:multiple sugar transport system permease protein